MKKRPNFKPGDVVLVIKTSPSGTYGRGKVLKLRPHHTFALAHPEYFIYACGLAEALFGIKEEIYAYEDSNSDDDWP